MKMSKRMFRTKQAIEAFQLCLECETLPDNKKLEVQNELNASRIRLQQQDDAVSHTTIFATFTKYFYPYAYYLYIFSFFFNFFFYYLTRLTKDYDFAQFYLFL